MRDQQAAPYWEIIARNLSKACCVVGGSVATVDAGGRTVFIVDAYPGETETSLKAKGVAYVVGRARYMDNPRGKIIGDEKRAVKHFFSAATPCVCSVCMSSANKLPKLCISV
jgi:hypothetical protein